MIGVRDVRLGNILTVSNLTGTVTCIDEEGIEISFSPSYNYVEGSFIGVPLTAEILEKCGFETQKPIYKATGAEVVYHKLVSINSKIDLVEESIGYTLSYYGTKIKYIHQLQNLYFALTGAELEVKL